MGNERLYSYLSYTRGCSKSTDHITSHVRISRSWDEFRDQCLNVNWFLSLTDAQEKVEHWRQEYNGFQPHSSLQNLTLDEVVTAASTFELQNDRCSTLNRPSEWEKVKTMRFSTPEWLPM